MTRTNDTNHHTIYFQTGRFVQQNGEWFYSTREDVERGPFISKEKAADDLEAYIYHRHNLESLGCFPEVSTPATTSVALD